MCRSANVPPNGEKLTSWRRRRDDDTTTTRRRGDDEATTTRRRHDERNANTGPTPDPNYKREPFATHSGKNLRKRTAGSVKHHLFEKKTHLPKPLFFGFNMLVFFGFFRAQVFFFTCNSGWSNLPPPCTS